jgi:hypothetical protein
MLRPRKNRGKGTEDEGQTNNQTFGWTVGAASTFFAHRRWLVLYWSGHIGRTIALIAWPALSAVGWLVARLGDELAQSLVAAISLGPSDGAKMTTQGVIGELYAFLTQERSMQRIGGGSETDVYRSKDGHYVVKVKGIQANNVAEAVAQARQLRDVSDEFAAYLGPEHSIPTDYLLAQDWAGQIYTIAIQPYLAQALPLAAVDRETLSSRQWAQIEQQLLTMLRRALRCYKRTGHMPDLYGAYSRNVAERRQLNTPWQWPRRVWHFFTQRLWRAHNLLLTPEAPPRVVLVDYDHVRWRGLWGRLYYAICWLLFWRELLLLTGWEATTLIEEEIRTVNRELNTS